MHSLGYRRSKQRTRLPLTARTKAQRLAFARWALERWPTEEHWVALAHGPIFWSDEVWCYNQPMKGSRFVTIHDVEDPETFALLREKGDGFMFWGSFAGITKGFTYCWLRRTKIDAPEYCRVILPLLFDWLEEVGRLPFLFMQDGAGAHRL
jgi:hypothetical protein